MLEYRGLKELAKIEGRPVTDFIALSPKNDPFYVGTPGDLAVARWFGEIWNEFGYGSGVHLRRVHYQLVSRADDILLPDGGHYENTERCWDFLGQASKMARYLELVDPAAFVDRRNHAPIINAENLEYTPTIDIHNPAEWSDFELPPFPDLPYYSLSEYNASQPYLLEIWCEKTTMDDVLTPLCASYGVNLVRGVGEMSITATLELVNRITNDGRPARIFYISDFDPAGKSMPVAVSRKAEYFIRKIESDADVALFPIVLNEEQCRQYRLPRTPIKETERRRDSFEKRFGVGATELDALEALRPGELNRIVERWLKNYYDVSFWRKVSNARGQVYDVMTRTQNEIHEEFDAEYAQLKTDYAALKDEMSDRLRAIVKKRDDLFASVTERLEDESPDIEKYPVPDPAAGDEDLDEDALYLSLRDYREQINGYKNFQGKPELED